MSLSHASLLLGSDDVVPPNRSTLPSSPRVTISLVTFNGTRWLPGCLASLRAQTLPPVEILVFDNDSSDGSIELLRTEAKRNNRLNVLESRENLGFARAHNRNIFAARGEFVCLVNQDMELHGRFLEEVAKPFGADDRIAAVQGRLRRLASDGTRLSVLDSTGLVMHRDRRAVSRGQGEQDGPRHEIPGPVWGADGPAPVYRRVALMDARVPASRGGWEVLDEDFFMYKEDVDLAWRLRNLGWTAWYEPAALAWHTRGAGGTAAKSFVGVARAGRSIPREVKVLSWRNQRLMQLKNESASRFLRDLPWIVRREVLAFGFMLLTDWRRLAAVLQLIRLVPRALHKRPYARRRPWAPPASEDGGAHP